MSAATDTVSDGRRRAMLRTAMGPTIPAALADPLVVEVMINPDGVLRLDRLDEGRIDTQVRYGPVQVERIIRPVASHGRTEVLGFIHIVSIRHLIRYGCYTSSRRSSFRRMHDDVTVEA